MPRLEPAAFWGEELALDTAAREGLGLMGPVQGDARASGVSATRPKCAFPFLEQRAGRRSDPKYFQLSGREAEDIGMKALPCGLASRRGGTEVTPLIRGRRQGGDER